MHSSIKAGYKAFDEYSIFDDDHMDDPILMGLVESACEGDLDTVLVLSDYLEERGDPRAELLRDLYSVLYDDWLFAPLSFRHVNLTKHHVLPLFSDFAETNTADFRRGEPGA